VSSETATAFTSNISVSFEMVFPHNMPADDDGLSPAQRRPLRNAVVGRSCAEAAAIEVAENLGSSELRSPGKDLLNAPF
jgi:hypothetical protein